MSNHSLTMYMGLAERHSEQHQLITEAILKVVAVEKIILLGTTETNIRTETLFNPHSATCRYVSHYFLLVLVPKNDKDILCRIQDRIENNLRHIIPTTVITMDVEQFAAWLNEGHPFAYTTVKHAMVLHDTGKTELSEPLDIDELKIRIRIDSIYTQGLNRYHEFLAGADLFRIRNQNKMAAFMLHQATEQALRSLLIVMTGFRINTHNIDKLIRYCSMLSYKLPAVFSRNNENNERLFQLLQKAYVDSRYKEDYSINTPDLMILTERVRTLQEIMEKTVGNKCNPNHV